MRETLVALAVIAVVAAACSSPKQDAAKSDTTTQVPPQIGSAPNSGTCPATGLWAECSVLYRVERAGLRVRIDSGEKADEKALRWAPRRFVLTVGANTRLEIYLYADSATRIAASARLDRKQFVNSTAQQTINRERTLIENANLIGLLTSLNSKMRERVSDALEAGAPQPSSPASK